MSNAAVVIPIHSAESSTVEALAARFLRAKRAIKEAEEIVKALGPQLIAALQEERGKGCAIAGLGAVTMVEVSAATRLDAKKAEELLRANGIAVPVTTSGGGVQLRPTLV